MPDARSMPTVTADLAKAEGLPFVTGSMLLEQAYDRLARTHAARDASTAVSAEQDADALGLFQAEWPILALHAGDTLPAAIRVVRARGFDVAHVTLDHDGRLRWGVRHLLAQRFPLLYVAALNAQTLLYVLLDTGRFHSWVTALLAVNLSIFAGKAVVACSLFRKGPPPLTAADLEHTLKSLRKSMDRTGSVARETEAQTRHRVAVIDAIRELQRAVHVARGFTDSVPTADRTAPALPTSLVDEVARVDDRLREMTATLDATPAGTLALLDQQAKRPVYATIPDWLRDSDL